MIAALRVFEVLRYRLGWLGVAGLVALIACLILALVLVMPMQAQLQKKSHELSWLSAQPQQKSAPLVLELNDAQALAKFYRQFPPVTDLSKLLAQLHQLALDKGIRLTNGEYKLSNDANNLNLMRYEIIFPVQANYKNLRDFIAEASQKFPTLGLTEVNIKRESVKESDVQIKLNYVLLLARGQ